MERSERFTLNKKGHMSCLYLGKVQSLGRKKDLKGSSTTRAIAVSPSSAAAAIIFSRVATSRNRSLLAPDGDDSHPHTVDDVRCEMHG